MPVANREKVKKRRDDMSFSSHSAAPSFGTADGNMNGAIPSTPKSPRRKLKLGDSLHAPQTPTSPRKPSVIKHPSSAPARSNRISVNSNHLRNATNSGIAAPPLFGSSQHSQSSPRTPRRKISVSSAGSDHSRNSITNSPRKPRLSAAPTLEPIGEKRKTKSPKPVAKKSPTRSSASKSPVAKKRVHGSMTDIPPPPPLDDDTRSPKRGGKKPTKHKPGTASPSPVSKKPTKHLPGTTSPSPVSKKPTKHMPGTTSPSPVAKKSPVPKKSPVAKKSPKSGIKKGAVATRKSTQSIPPPPLDSPPSSPKSPKSKTPVPVPAVEKESATPGEKEEGRNSFKMKSLIPQLPVRKSKGMADSSSHHTKTSGNAIPQDTTRTSVSETSSLPLQTKVMPNGKTVVFAPIAVSSAEEARELNKNPAARANLRESMMKDMKKLGYSMRNFSIRGFQVEEKPPRTLAIIWGLMAAELGFDLASTMIAFASFLGTEECCGQEIKLVALPISSTLPFLLLVLAEMTFLCRAIQLSLWPSLEHNSEHFDSTSKYGKLVSACCCCLKWNARMLVRLVNVCTLLNPFLSCLVAWVLLYEANRTEAFVVMALEAMSIVLHLISVKLEGELRNIWMIIFHCLPIIPFFVTVSLILIYLKQGGVCYVVEKDLFLFTGCEVCDDGTPPINGMCGDTTISTGNLFDTLTEAEEFSDFADRADQGTYCAEPGDPVQSSFCFFTY